MNPEEYLDRLIERRERGEVQIPVASDEVAASLAAAEVLAQLRKIDVPTGFAGHLELYVRAHARGLAQQNGSTAPIERLRSPAGLPRFHMRQTWIAILGIAAVLMLACAGVLTVSARSLPGDALYGLKQAENQLTLNFASDARNRASFQIDQLHNTLVDLSTVVNDKRGEEATRMALNIVAAKTNEVVKQLLLCLQVLIERPYSSISIVSLPRKSSYYVICWIKWIGRCGWPSPGNWEP
jgi:hypothetical protein